MLMQVQGRIGEAGGEREERGCAFDFPGGLHGSLRKSTLNALGVNAAYGGWQNAAPRLFFANGLRECFSLFPFFRSRLIGYANTCVDRGSLARGYCCV